MQVLIVEGNLTLGGLWARHLGRAGHKVETVATAEEAMSAISRRAYHVIVLDLVLGSGSALAVSDYAGVRSPWSKVIFVTNTRFFADGSIFALSCNACAYMQSDVPPEDLAAMVEHHGATN